MQFGVLNPALLVQAATKFLQNLIDDQPGALASQVLAKYSVLNFMVSEALHCRRTRSSLFRMMLKGKFGPVAIDEADAL